MKILVIFTGGTIGSVVDDNWISVNSTAKYKLIEGYKKQCNDFETEFDIVSPYYILSENLSSNELTLLFKCVKESVGKNYDGIIITHGTDTLQYTSAAIGLLLPTPEIPIIFVSSAYPLENPLENGSQNFAAAVAFIKSKIETGVFVAYKNEDETAVNIHTATRIKAHAESSADIYSIDNNPFAYFNDNIIDVNPDYKKGQISEEIVFSNFCAYPKILMIESMPGNFYNYSLDGCSAVILSPYHSATLDVNNVKFVEFCINAAERGIPVFLVNVPDGMRYESVKKLNNLNVISLPFGSKISIYMKCWIALSANKNIKEYVIKPVSQEFVDKGDSKWK